MARVILVSAQDLLDLNLGLSDSGLTRIRSQYDPQYILAPARAQGVAISTSLSVPLVIVFLEHSFFIFPALIFKSFSLLLRIVKPESPIPCPNRPRLSCEISEAVILRHRAGEILNLKSEFTFCQSHEKCPERVVNGLRPLIFLSL